MGAPSAAPPAHADALGSQLSVLLGCFLSVPLWLVTSSLLSCLDPPEFSLPAVTSVSTIPCPFPSDFHQTLSHSHAAPSQASRRLCSPTLTQDKLSPQCSFPFFSPFPAQAPSTHSSKCPYFTKKRGRFQRRGKAVPGNTCCPNISSGLSNYWFS